MRLRGFSELAAAPFFPPMAVAMLFAGLGDATAGPYLILYAADKAHLSPLALGLFVTARSTCGIVLSTLLGRWFDRTQSPKPLFLALSMTLLGYTFLTLITPTFALLLIACLPLGIGSAAFPQLFALARRQFDTLDPSLAGRGITVLRAIWSAAWTAGPAVGAAVISPFDFDGVFVTTGLFAAIAIALVIRMRKRLPATGPGSGAGPIQQRGTVMGAKFTVLSLIFFHIAMFAGAIALPIVVTRDLHGDPADVGIIYSLCAGLEVVVMLLFALRPTPEENRRWLSAGFVAMVLYFVAALLVPSVGGLMAAQLLRAIAIGLIGCIGIGYVQSLLLGRVGLATTLFSNSVNVGGMVAGLVAGAWANAFGYLSMFGACAALGGLGLLALQFQPRSPTPP